MNVGFGGKHEEKEHELHIPRVSLYLPSVQCRAREYILTFSNAHYRIRYDASGGVMTQMTEVGSRIRAWSAWACRQCLHAILAGVTD
jgi:hypothetical protein